MYPILQHGCVHQMSPHEISFAQMYMTMQLLAGLQHGDAALEAAKLLRPWRPEDEALLSTVERTVRVGILG